MCYNGKIGISFAYSLVVLGCIAEIFKTEYIEEGRDFMRFEKAVYADGFDRCKRFELKPGFMPLILDLSKNEAEILRLAMEGSPILSSDYTGLALTTTQRRVEQELLDKFQQILNSKVKGWFILGCRKVSGEQGSNIMAELFLYHSSSQLYFALSLSEAKLPQHLRSQFHRIIDAIIKMEV